MSVLAAKLPCEESGCRGREEVREVRGFIKVLHHQTFSGGRIRYCWLADRQLAGSSHTVMLVSEVSEVSAGSRSRSQMVSRVVRRQSGCEDWGLSLSGGWGQGQWLAVKQVRQGSPADLAGILAGDSLVQIQEQLVIFLDLHQVELLIQTAHTELSLTVER